MTFGYLVDAGYGQGRVIGGGDVVWFWIIDFSTPDAWWLVTVFVAKLLAVFKLGRALVLPMVLLSAIHAATFGTAAVAFFCSEFFELLSVLRREVSEGKISRVVGFRSESMSVGAAALGLSGVVGTPALVKLLGEFYEASHGDGCGQHTKNFVVQGTGDVLAEGVHFCSLVGARARSVHGPFLIPIEKWAGVHFEGVHDIGRVHYRFNGDKVGFKCVFEGLPGAKINEVCYEGSFLAVFCPFTSGCAELEVCEGRGDVLAFEWIYVGIEVLVVGEACPESICFRGRTVERFRSGPKEFCGRVCRCGHGCWRRRRSRWV